MSVEKNLWITAIPARITGWINGIHQYWFIVAILLLFFFRFDLNGNEEHYMQIAKAFYNPDWLYSSFTFQEHPGTMLVYLYIVGYSLRFFSFEITVALWRFLLCLLIAYPLVKIYRSLGVQNIFIILHLPILYLAQGRRLYDIHFNQSFFGGEWIFLSVEPKVFAYVFVFFALYHFLNEKYFLATVFLAGASYFHLLVGGWVMAYFILYRLVTTRSFKKPMQEGLLFVICLLPFLYYLSPLLSQSFSGIDTTEKIDWIFTYFKQPYHTAIFLSIEYFLRVSFEGFMVSLFFFVMCVFIFGHNQDKYNQKLNQLNKLIFIGTLISVLLAYFDRSGAFVKYFPFRINALFAFLVFLQLTLLLNGFVVRKEKVKYVQFGILLWFILFTIPRQTWQMGQNLHHSFSKKNNDPAYVEICAYIKEYTPTDAQLLFLPQDFHPDDLHSLDGYRSMVRDTERDRFVFFFAAPVSPDPAKTLEWYRRVLLKKSITAKRLDLCSFLMTEEIGLVLTNFDLEKRDCYSLVHQNEVYRLYQARRP
jgi:hypothetical protein